MEFAAAALSAVGSAVGGVASAVTGTAAAASGGITGTLGSLLSAGSSMGSLSIGGGAGSLFSGGSLLSSLLSGGATVASMMASRNAADEQASANMARANDAILEQGVERVRGIERRDGLRRSLLERLGEQDVAAAASGVDLSFGTPALAREEAARDGERALVQDQSTEDLRISRLQERAEEFTRAARSNRRAGTIRALGSAASFGAQTLRRG